MPLTATLYSIYCVFARGHVLESHSHPLCACFFNPLGRLMVEITGQVIGKSSEKAASGVSGWVLPIPLLVASSPQPPEAGTLTVLL